jgi:predicted enzyme related to lactoylglutathione lyase
MGDRESYAPGTFSWADLSTTDQDGAKAFYGALFGWEAIDRPVGDGVVYSMMTLGGKNVAAISPQPQQQRDAGVPPTWNSYVTVQNADDALARARELGATVHADAFDVLDAGRMGVIQDPQGAYFLVWEPRTNIGASLVNVAGALCWNELASPDPEASATFYGALLGWETRTMEGSEPPYLVVMNDGHGNGGIRPMMPAEPLPYWLVYFGVEDLDASMARVEELGGAKLAGPIPIGPGTLGFVQDPQGAVFALYTGVFDP